MSQRKGAKSGNGPPNAHMEAETPDKFSVRGFRPYRQWAVDCDYLRGLPDAERQWMRRFLSEYYDADNKLLRPEQHVSKCSVCRKGGDCGKRPTKAIHDTDALRRECYRRQNYAYFDAHSRGLVGLWEDFDCVDAEGKVTPRGAVAGVSVEVTRVRFENGDTEGADSGAVTSAASSFARRLYRGKR